MTAFAADVDADAKKVIEKAIEAHGGKDALGKYKAGETAVKGSMIMLGTDITFTGDIIHAMPDRSKTTLTLEVAQQKVKLVQLSNGKDVSISVNGAAKKLSDDEKTEIRQAGFLQEIAMLLPLLDGKKYTVKSSKDEKVGEADAAVVTVSADGFNETKFYFDKKTELMVKMARKAVTESGEKALEESILSDFKKIDGIMMPMTTTVTRDGKKFMTMTVVTAKVLDKIDPKVFTAD